MLIMERRTDGTTGHHFYNDDTQYDRYGYNRVGRYHHAHDENTWPPPEGYPEELWPIKPGPTPWPTAPADHPGHIRTPEDEADPAKMDAHRVQGDEKQAIRVIDVYESEMQEKYPTGNYLPLAERPPGIRQRFTKFAARLERRKPGTPIESTRQ